MKSEYGEVTNPERALWQMVLLHAIEEALHGPKNVTPYQRPLMWKEARDYVTKPSEDLAMVCAMAGVDMDALVERMRAQLSPIVCAIGLVCD